MPRPLILIGLPTHDGRMQFGTAQAALRWENPVVLSQYTDELGEAPFNVAIAMVATSDLCRTFNLLWCEALNRGATHFAMLHDDLVPNDQWLIKLWLAMRQTGAACVSAVSPIKNESGLTSTAVAPPVPAAPQHLPGWLWSIKHQVTLAELEHMPTVFGAADVPGCQAGDVLLVNTGCMLLDVQAITEQIPDFCFDMAHAIENVDGFWKCKNDRTEDWEMARLLAQANLSAVCHQGVRLQHFGGKVYRAGR